MEAALVRITALIAILVGALHGLFGIATVPHLGAATSDSAIGKIVLDSQDRFYGASFMGYGALLLLYLSDPARYRLVFQIVAAAVFVGGCARVLGFALHGAPPAQVLGLLAIELIFPPLLVFLEQRTQRAV